jgi:hypothetical protein
MVLAPENNSLAAEDEEEEELEDWLDLRLGDRSRLERIARCSKRPLASLN